MNISQYNLVTNMCLFTAYGLWQAKDTFQLPTWIGLFIYNIPVANSVWLLVWLWIIISNKLFGFRTQYFIGIVAEDISFYQNKRIHDHMSSFPYEECYARSRCQWQGQVSTSHSICGLLLVFPALIMTSSNGSIFRVTGPLCVEFTGHR